MEEEVDVVFVPETQLDIVEVKKLPKRYAKGYVPEPTAKPASKIKRGDIWSPLF